MNTTNVPLYKEVRDQIVESLIRGEWQPEELLPSERRLSERFNVGMSTIRAAIGELVQANILIRKQGKGTFVSHHNDRGSRYRFFNVVRNDGVKTPFDRKLTSLKREKASADLLTVFSFPRPNRAEIIRLRMKFVTGGGPPFAICEVVIPAHVFADINAADISDERTSLYAVYQEKFGVNIIRVVEQLSAVKASAAVV